MNSTQREFACRVHAKVGPADDAEGPALREHVQVVLTIADGRKLERELCYRPGSPEDQMTPVELEHKFRRLDAHRGAVANTGAIVHPVARVELLDDSGALTERPGIN